jgi:hypothetical protein
VPGRLFDPLDNRHLPIDATSYHRRVICVEDLRFGIEFADRVIIGKSVLFGVILGSENYKRIEGHDSPPLVFGLPVALDENALFTKRRIRDTETLSRAASDEQNTQFLDERVTAACGDFGQAGARECPRLHTRITISLTLDLCSRFSQLLGSKALQAFRTLFVFRSYLSDAVIQRFLGSTLGLCRSLLQGFHLRFRLGPDLL